MVLCLKARWMEDWMDPSAGLNMLAKTTFPVPVGNQTLIVQSVFCHISD
jgi:hypothetical protein